MVGQLVKKFKGDFNANHSYPIDSLTAGNYLVKIVGGQQDVYFEGSTTIVFIFFECKRSFFTEETFFI
jgi:hypothetical protein